MLKLALLACTVGLVAGCNSGDNTTTETAATDSATTQAVGDGWIKLFDGASTAGWHRYGGGPAGPAWKAMDGVLYLDTTKKSGEVSDGGDLTTDEEFDNFHLKYEWKIAKGGNSGVIFFVHEDSAKYKNTWDTGPEMQILDNDGHSDGKLTKHRAGDLYDLIQCTKETVKPVGEWNQAEIKSQNGKLDFYLNGENVVSTTMWDDNWNKLVAGSKFKTMAGFGAYKKGRIALQDHGNMVSFRNIQLQKL